MEDVIWFLVNYPVFLLLVMNICAYWKRDRVTEALAKVIDSRKRIKIDIVDIVCIAGTISGFFGNILIKRYLNRGDLNIFKEYLGFDLMLMCVSILIYRIKKMDI